MRRNKIKHCNTETTHINDRMSPWDPNEYNQPKDLSSEIPTYRKEIVNKFLHQIKNCPKKKRENTQQHNKIHKESDQRVLR